MSLSFERFFEFARATDLAPFEAELKRILKQRFDDRPHGREQEWDNALAALPEIKTDHLDFSNDAITIGTADERGINPQLEQQLKAFKPWRKGPLQFFGTFIDTEWRSDLKWSRLAPHLGDLAGKRILDIGCGNGYYMLRMLGGGARYVLGADPTLLFLYQFAIVERFTHNLPAFIVPLRSEDLPAFKTFDMVFSMGVLYHRKSPIEHLAELGSFLRSGGDVIIETLIVDDDRTEVLVPDDRYAMMRNVWAIPGIATLESWLADAGFTGIRTVDITRTTTTEQRATDWMTFQSLEDFLDPENELKTIEGYPAPTRAIVTAKKG